MRAAYTVGRDGGQKVLVETRLLMAIDAEESAFEPSRSLLRQGMAKWDEKLAITATGGCSTDQQHQ